MIESPHSRGSFYHSVDQIFIESDMFMGSFGMPLYFSTQELGKTPFHADEYRLPRGAVILLFSSPWLVNLVLSYIWSDQARA